MDNIYGDYHAQTSGEKMRIDNSSSTKQIRHGKQSDVLTKWKSSCTATIPKVQGHTKLPPNTGNLIPNDYYQQFKGWYEASRVQEANRSDEQKTFWSTFKWRHMIDPNAKRTWVTPNRQGMINVVTMMIFSLVVLGDISNRACHRRRIHILTIVRPVSFLAHAVHVVMEATLDPRTALDPAPLWRVVVMTVMRLRVVQPHPVMPVSSKGADMMGLLLHRWRHIHVIQLQLTTPCNRD